MCPYTVCCIIHVLGKTYSAFTYNKGFIKNLQSCDSFQKNEDLPHLLFQILLRILSDPPSYLSNPFANAGPLKASPSKMYSVTLICGQSHTCTRPGRLGSWESRSNLPLALFAQGGAPSLLNDLYCPRLLSERLLKFPSPRPGKYGHIL